MSARKGVCRCCGLERWLPARELCKGCYSSPAREDYPTTKNKITDVLDDWDVLRRRGMTKRQASVEMGYAKKTLERILHRARQQGMNVVM